MTHVILIDYTGTIVVAEEYNENPPHVFHFTDIKDLLKPGEPNHPDWDPDEQFKVVMPQYEYIDSKNGMMVYCRRRCAWCINQWQDGDAPIYENRSGNLFCRCCGYPKANPPWPLQGGRTPPDQVFPDEGSNFKAS